MNTSPIRSSCSPLPLGERGEMLLTHACHFEFEILNGPFLVLGNAPRSAARGFEHGTDAQIQMQAALLIQTQRLLVVHVTADRVDWAVHPKQLDSPAVRWFGDGHLPARGGDFDVQSGSLGFE